MATTTTSDLLQKLHEHLEQVQRQQETPFDAHLLQQCELYFSTTDIRQADVYAWESLFLQIAELLPHLQQDPSSLERVILKLARPLSFDRVKSLDLLSGLQLEASAYHDITLTLLGKATAAELDIEFIANKPDLVFALVKLWLAAEDTGTAVKASNLLLMLLSMSKNVPNTLSTALPSIYGHGPMWKRMFGDKDIFELLFSTCSLKASNNGLSINLSKNRRTIAQARLLEWLPQVGALDWDTLIRCHHNDIVTAYGLKSGDGLLAFAAEYMVDYDDDILMHISLIDFFSNLLKLVRRRAAASDPTMSLSLQYLISRRLHHRTMSYWLSASATSIEASFLGGPSAAYVATYAATYPEHFESAGLIEVTTKLRNSLDQSAARWAQGQSPKHELHVLASIPRTSIFPADASAAAFNASPLSLLPCKSTNEDALNTLATIFHGPQGTAPSEALTIPNPDPHSLNIDISDARWNVERDAANGLFWLYFSQTPSLFSELIRHAEIIALKEKAQAAINVMLAIATANWGQESSNEDGTITATSDAAAERHARVVAVSAVNISLPKSGIEALLHPPIRNVIVPYLLRPAQSFSNLVGGRGDAESSAYRVASAKFELLVAVSKRLNGLVVSKPDANDLIVLADALKRRVAEGPLSAGGEIGGRIGTLEL